MKQLQKRYISLLFILCLMLLPACQGSTPAPEGESEDVAVPAENIPSHPDTSVSASASFVGSDSEPTASDVRSAAEPEESVPASGEEPSSLPEDAPESEPVQHPEVENTTLYVLMYHSFVPDGTNCNNWTLTEGRFREDLQWLADNGYSTVLPSELAAGQPLPEKAVMLTFDDGYANNYTTAYPVLQEFQAKAVISLIGHYIAEENPDFLNWEMCDEMLRSGLVEIGSHTYDCHKGESPRGIQRAEGERRKDYEARVFADLQDSIDLIESNLDITVQFFAYPHGQTEEWADEFLKEHFAVSVTTYYGGTDISNGLYDMNRYNVSMGVPLSELIPAG